LLRTALIGGQPVPQEDFLAYLRGFPIGRALDFPRATTLPRTFEL